MTTLRTAAQQALEVLKSGLVVSWHSQVVTDLEAALAQQAEPVEPVAWGCFKDGELQSELVSTKADVDFWVASDEPHMQGMVAGPLYAAPPQRPAEPQEQPICDECGRKKADGWALYCVDCMEPVFAPHNAIEYIKTLELERQMALNALLMMRDQYGEEDCPACDHADAAIKALRGKK